ASRTAGSDNEQLALFLGDPCEIPGIRAPIDPNFGSKLFSVEFYIDYRSILSALSLRLDQLSGQIIVRHLPCQQAWIGAANIAQAGNREPLIGEPHQMRSISGI